MKKNVSFLPDSQHMNLSATLYGSDDDSDSDSDDKKM
jgi:hypothetical protein